MNRRHGRTLTTGVAAVLLVLSLLLGPAPALAARDRSAPTAPTNLQATAATATSVTLAWNPSTDNSGSFSYLVQLVSPSLSTAFSQAQTSFTWGSLSPSTTYSFYVYAVDGAGNRSANSNTVTITTQSDTTPPSAPVLSGSVLSPSQVALSWTAATDENQWWSLAYDVWVNGSPATNVNWQGERSVRIRHLTPATTYVFTVQAWDSSGNRSTSNAVTLTTEASSDTVPPTAPANLHLVFDQGCAEVYLGWAQATDDVDPQSAIEYEIYVNGVPSPLAVSGGVDQDFVYGTAHGDNTFVVKAVDRTGNTSAPSNALTLWLWPC